MDEDCRSWDQGAINATLTGNEEFYDACVPDPFFPEDSTSGWQWPGAFPYDQMDSAFGTFLQCLKNVFIMVSKIYKKVALFHTQMLR